MSADTSAPKKRVLKPIIISNDKKMLLNSPNLLSNLRFPFSIHQYKEDVIYCAKNCDFLKGDSQDVLIVNRVNLVSKSCRTIAKCTSKGVTVETSSDAISAVIGQKNFETVLSALSNVFNEENKVRGILALLTSVKKNTTATQTDVEVVKKYQESSCQTVDTRLNMLVKEKQRKRIRRQPLQPYVVTNGTNKIKKLVIDIDSMSKNRSLLKKIKEGEPDFQSTNLPELKPILDDDNMSTISDISLSSLPSVPGILENTEIFFNAIDKVTDNTLNPYTITLRDGSTIMIPIKPEDDFHIAIPDILKNVTNEEKMKLIYHQTAIDFKMCLQQDEDGYYPLHIAVLHSDTDLVRRMCKAVRARRETVDIQGGPDQLTALHMSIRQNAPLEITRTLLLSGANPLVTDGERRSSLHLAADADTPHLELLVQYCDQNARSILNNSPNLWRPEFENAHDNKFTKYLYDYVSEMFDDQGYTPLMLSSEAGLPQHTYLLASRAGPLVDAAAPTSGATALYRVVAGTCAQLKDSLTAKPPEHYLKTIEILVEHGADPSIENHAGSSVNTLLTEFNISALSMTIANKMTSMKHGRLHQGNLNMILYKQNDGTIDYKDINSVSYRKSSVNNYNCNVTNKDVKDKMNWPVVCKKEIGRISEGEIKIKTEDSDELNTNLDTNTDVQQIKSNNHNIQQIKLENVTIKQNNNVSVIPANVDKDNKNETPEVSKGNDRMNKRLILRRVITDKMYELQESKSKGKLVKVNNEKSIDTPKSFTPKLQLGKIVMKDVKNKTELNKVVTAAPILKRIVNDLEKSILASINDTKPAKEKKTDNVVIVENVALKKGFSIPNILRATSSKTVNPKDIVITPKAEEKIVITSKVTGKDDEINVRKRKLDSK